MRVTCQIDEADIENDNGREVPGVIAECSRCGHTERSFGTGLASRKRCLVLLRENCPEEEQNYYVDEDE